MHKIASSNPNGNFIKNKHYCTIKKSKFYIIYLAVHICMLMVHVKGFNCSVFCVIWTSANCAWKRIWDVDEATALNDFETKAFCYNESAVFQ